MGSTTGSGLERPSDVSVPASQGCPLRLPAARRNLRRSRAQGSSSWQLGELPRGRHGAAFPRGCLRREGEARQTTKKPQKLAQGCPLEVPLAPGSGQAGRMGLAGSGLWSPTKYHTATEGLCEYMAKSGMDR